jgi:hypothetical protein
VLILAGFFFLRLVEAIIRWDLLLEYFPTSNIPIYLALTGVSWGCAFLVLGGGLVRGSRWAPRLSRILAIAFAVYWWLDSLLLALDPAVRGAWLFRLAVTLLLLALTFWVLSRPGAKTYFGELNG